MEIPEILLVVVLSDIRTRGSIQKWPWKGCKEKLVKAGYFVQFAPNAKSQESDIMQPSNQLTPTQARDILSDLLENKILMLETEEGPSRKAKRKRNLESSPPLYICGSTPTQYHLPPIPHLLSMRHPPMLHLLMT